MSMQEVNKKKVYVGMSGGVDSSVSAYILKEAGYEVAGVFIKVWQPEGIPCTWKEDRLDAMRVAAQLDIPFVTLDLEAEYKKDVIDYMIAEYSAGHTPNPDVCCNQYVKFGGFLDYALSSGADYVATGHYTQNIFNKETQQYEIVASGDAEKDQGYFLWTLTQEKLAHVLFPIGHFTKSEVRKIAEDANLYTATKKDSQGLCFIGKLDIKEFLKDHIKTQEGAVLDTSGKTIGHHDGAFLFTLGERHGFTIDVKTTDDSPYFVVGKDITANTITVTHKNASTSRTNTIKISKTNWIGQKPQTAKKYTARIRHRGELRYCTLESIEESTAVFSFEDKDSTASSGQSLVLYDGDILVGGGIIDI
jgi:tRNA-uridine 2-sulfurtransferase